MLVIISVPILLHFNRDSVYFLNGTEWGYLISFCEHLYVLKKISTYSFHVFAFLTHGLNYFHTPSRQFPCISATASDFPTPSQFKKNALHYFYI